MNGCSCEKCACYLVCKYQVPALVGDCFVPKEQANAIPLPCKLGTTVYVINRQRQLEECVVIGAYDKLLNGNLLMTVKRKGGNNRYDLSPCDLGTVWFFEEEKAVVYRSEVWWG